MVRTVLQCLIGGLLVCSSPGADVRVTKRGSARTPVNLAAFCPRSDPYAATIRRVVSDDLGRSGWLLPDASDDAAVRVEGRCTTEGGDVSVVCRAMNAHTGRSFLNRRYTDRTERVRAMAHQVSDDIVRAVTGHRGIASSRLALVGRRAGSTELYLVDADGEGLLQLTHDRAVCLGPDWAPDGKALLYTSFVQGFPDVYLADLATGRRRRVAGFSGLNSGATVSPDGKRVALVLSKDGNPELYVIGLNGGRATRLTHTKHAAEAGPTWSPDGKRIAFVSDRSGAPQVYVMSARGGRSERLTMKGTENVSPDWGPDGRLVFSTRVDGRYRLAVLDLKTRADRVYGMGAADFENPAWAPDGRHIACARTERYRSDIYILDTVEDALLRLTTVSGDWYAPAWSP